MNELHVPVAEPELIAKPDPKLGRAPLPPVAVVGVTLLAVGIVAVAAQLGTVLLLGSFDIAFWGWSAAAVVAVAAGIFVVTRRYARWADWWRTVWIWFVVASVVAFGVTVAAFTPRHTASGLPDRPAFGLVSEWSVVDEPEQRERVETGLYEVSTTDTLPCYLGQDWVACTAAYLAEYDRACVPWELTIASRSVCDGYQDMIEGMQGEGGPGWTVTSLGGWGTLVVIPQTQVKITPAVRHVAVCYLLLFGECL